MWQAAPPPPRRAPSGAFWYAPGAPSPRRVHWFFQTVGFLLMLYAVSNIWGLVHNLTGQQAPLDPIMVTLAFVLTVPWLKTRTGSGYLFLAAAFMAAFVVMGFLGEYRAAFEGIQLLRHLLKPTTTILILPWILLAVLTPRLYRRLIAAVSLLVAGGALLACVQLVIPGPFEKIMHAPGRGAGLWLNPNNCGLACSLVLMYSLALPPFPWPRANMILRGILVAGTLASLSRASIGMVIVGCLVYAALTGRARQIARIAAGLVLGTLLFYGSVQWYGEAMPDVMRDRVDKLEALFGGGVEGATEELAGSRLAVWRSAWEGIRPHWMTGLGHGHTSWIAGGLAPHNLYLAVLGEAGALGLLGLLALLGWVMFGATRCPEAHQRAAWIASTVLVLGHGMADHAFIGTLATGQSLTMIVAGTEVCRRYPVRPGELERPGMWP